MAGRALLTVASRLALCVWVAALSVGLPAGAVAQEVPDSARRFLAEGRHWKASRAIRPALNPLASAPLADRLLLAEAEAGWRNWSGAIEALSAPGVDVDQAPPRYWYELGRARRATGDRTGAADAFERYVAATARAGVVVGEPDRAEGRSDAGAAADGAGSATQGGPQQALARARTSAATQSLVALSILSRRFAAQGVGEEALAYLNELKLRTPVVADWTGLEAAREAARTGSAGLAASLLDAVADPGVGALGWRLESDAWAAAGDTARALEALARDRLDGETVAVAAGRLGREWRYKLALGDESGAVAAMEDLLGRTTRGSEALAAARAHWRVAAGSGPEVLRRVALAFGGGREYGLAVRAWRVAERRGAVLSESDRMALARARAGSGDPNGAADLYRGLSVSADPAVAVAALDAWIGVRTRQGRRGDARTLQDRLLERYPATAEAVDVVFFRADVHHDARRYDQAAGAYRRAASLLPTADRAGLSRMRLGQIRLAQGEPGLAAQVFRDYLADFPQGRRWEEASYWAIRSARAAGDTAGVGAARARLLAQGPVSYYALALAETDGVELALPPASGAADSAADGASPRVPEWMVGELGVLAALDEAGLNQGAEAHLAALRQVALDTAQVALGLADALNHGGRTVDGIRLGWALQERGMAWSRALLRVVYPFPHRALVVSRSDEMGLDPYLVAGLIRQESAFSAEIGSHAGAIGLMQIMPPTGRQLARAVGPPGYSTESLRTAEVNVHLGTLYLAEMLERYGGDLPLALSAYNAGPTRANRWRNFPEANDPHRLTERIPFVETRGYVKNVTRNRALYRWLYGPDAARP